MTEWIRNGHSKNFFEHFFEKWLIKRIANFIGESGSSLAVQFVLYECVDTALRLLAPFMPFITEELWQRFVRKPSNMNVPSICVAEYPQVSQVGYFIFIFSLIFTKAHKNFFKL